MKKRRLVHLILFVILFKVSTGKSIEISSYAQLSRNGKTVDTEAHSDNKR
jgi:hypothetical protein